MRRNWRPQPRERFAEVYRHAHEAWDREPIGHYERSGFGYPDGYHGAYAERPAYFTRRGRLKPPEPEGSGWPYEHRTLTAEAEARHLRALADRDLARAVDSAVYNALGPQADTVSVYADAGRITLAGTVQSPGAARGALAVAERVPGVRRVRSAIWIEHR